MFGLTSAVILVIIIILIALIFDFTNGFHDSANAIATIVSTKGMSPRNAVIMAAFFNFIAAFGFGVAVANTISKIVIVDKVTSAMIPYVILAGLIAAISWNLITWYLGIPSSSSHTLVGGIVGAGIAAAGIAAIHYQAVEVIVIFMFMSPLIGLAIGFLFMVAVLWACRKKPQTKIDRWFNKLQIASSAAYCFSHGTNDAQKTIGIITPLLFSIGYAAVGTDPNHLLVPFWVIIIAYTAIALGTLAGGWRIVKTMGHKITKLRPVHGFSAQAAGSVTIIGASVAGIPVSTTHVISASIMGVGATKRVSAVRWGVARKIVWAWIITIPASMAIGFVSFEIIRLFI